MLAGTETRNRCRYEKKKRMSDSTVFVQYRMPCLVVGNRALFLETNS